MPSSFLPLFTRVRGKSNSAKFARGIGRWHHAWQWNRLARFGAEAGGDEEVLEVGACSQRR